MRRPEPKLLAAILSCTLVLAGCAIGPDYQRPDTKLPADFSQATATANSAAVDKEWWTLFQDPILNDLVTQARSYNTDMQLAVARIEETQGLVRESYSAFFPEIDGQGNATRSSVSSSTAIPKQGIGIPLRDDFKTVLTTSFELDVWGRLRRASESARAQTLASQYNRDTVELTLIGQVAQTYLSLRAYDAQLAAAQASLKNREDALAITRSRHLGGLASSLDVQQAETNRATLVAQIATLRRQRGLAQDQLGLLTGRPNLTVAEGDLRTLPLPPIPPAGLPSTLLEARPDLRQAEEQLVSANALIGVAKAAMFPTISLTGSYGNESAQLANLFTSPANLWSYGAGLSMPIFDAGKNLARLDQASARQKQAMATYQKAVQTAFKEVNDAIVSLRETGAGESAQQTRVDAAQKSLKLSQLRYQAGYSPFLEVLDAQRSANDAQLDLITARQARLSAAVDLFKALGGGWRDPAPRQPPESVATTTVDGNSTPSP